MAWGWHKTVRYGFAEAVICVLRLRATNSRLGRERARFLTNPRGPLGVAPRRNLGGTLAVDVAKARTFLHEIAESQFLVWSSSVAAKRAVARSCVGLRWILMVGAKGLEPLTSWV